MSDISELKARVEELEREKLQKRVRELEAELVKKQDKNKNITLRRINLAPAATLLIIVCVCGIAYLLRDEVSSLATRIGLPGAPTSTSIFHATPTMVFIGGCSAAELQSPEVQAYLAALNEELANSDPVKIEVFLAGVQSAYDNLPECVRNYVEPFNTPLALGFKAAAQARDEVDPAKMQNYKDISSGQMQAAEANISFFNGLSIAYTNPRWVKGPTPTTDPGSTPATGPGSTPPTGPGSQAGGSGSTLKILDETVNHPSACFDTFTGESFVYTEVLLASGGSPFKGYTWSTMGLPMGTTIWPLTGVFTSNGGSLDPNKPEQTVQLEVSDGTSTATATVTFHILIRTSAPDLTLWDPCPEPVPSFGQWEGVPTYALADAQANKPYGASLPVMGGMVEGEGGMPPFSWFEDTTYSGRSDFDLSGLVIDQSSGIVRGTPFNSASGKTLRFRIIVKDSAGFTALPGPIFTIFVK
jgi:hypothetical protein